MKMILSIPKTISRKHKVSNASQVSAFRKISMRESSRVFEKFFQNKLNASTKKISQK
jgi:hypothetical protein